MSLMWRSARPASVCLGMYSANAWNLEQLSLWYRSKALTLPGFEVQFPMGKPTLKICVHHGKGRLSGWKWPPDDILWAGCFIDGSGKTQILPYVFNWVGITAPRECCVFYILGTRCRVEDNTVPIPGIGGPDKPSLTEIWQIQSAVANRQHALLCSFDE